MIGRAEPGCAGGSAARPTVQKRQPAERQTTHAADWTMHKPWPWLRAAFKRPLLAARVLGPLYEA
jgi:hypothetical protein